MAVCALARGNSVRSGQLEARARVVELPVGPQHGVMTAIAGRGESRRDVVHRGDGIVVVSLVTRDAGRTGDVVVVVDVTIAALARRHGVRSGQWKSSAVVVEGRIKPG